MLLFAADATRKSAQPIFFVKLACIAVALSATTVFVDAPDIAVQYGTHHGPDPGTDCQDLDSDGQNDRCVLPAEKTMDFGTVNLGTAATVVLAWFAPAHWTRSIPRATARGFGTTCPAACKPPSNPSVTMKLARQTCSAH